MSYLENSIVIINSFFWTFVVMKNNTWSYSIEVTF